MNQPPRRKKILILITKSNFGGAQRYVLELAKRIPRDTFELAVVLGGTGLPGAPQGLLAEKLARLEIRTIFIPSLQRDVNPSKELRVFWDLLRLFKKEKPDIIHLNSSKIGGIGSLAGRIAGIPKIIFTIHGWAFNEERGVLGKALIRLASMLTVRFATDLIAISKQSMEETRLLGNTDQKLHLIYNGIEPNYERKDKQALRKKLDLPEEGLILGTIAELTKNKGLSYALSAFADLKNPKATLAIIGEGDERKNLEVQARELGIENSVRFLGFKDNASEYLPAFDIFFLSSIKEGLPFVLLEAGLAGLPVVAPRIGGIPEIILDEQAGILVEPKSTDALRHAWERLIPNPGAREMLGKNLREHVLGSFSLGYMVSQTLRVYDPTLTERPVSSVFVIIRNQLGNFLLHLRDDKTRHMPDQWSLIAGALAPEETPIAGAIRETKEETNLTLKKVRVIRTKTFNNQNLSLVYGEVDTGSEDMVLGEGRELRFFPPRSAKEFIAHLPYSNPVLETFTEFLEHERLA